MAKDSSGTIILLGGLGVAAYGYFAGWFNSILTQFGLPLPSGTAAATIPTTTTVTAAQLAALQAAAAAQGAASNVGAPVGPAAISPTAGLAPLPALGTVLTTSAQLAGQVAAKDAYILPGPALISQAPAGYTLATDAAAAEVGGGSGGFYLRNDVAAALLGVQNLLATAAGQPPLSLATLYTVPISNLAQLQTIMTAQGLSGHTRYGMGDFARHMYSRTGRIR